MEWDHLSISAGNLYIQLRGNTHVIGVTIERNEAVILNLITKFLDCLKLQVIRQLYRLAE
jgi:riboflavin synthase